MGFVSFVYHYGFCRGFTVVLRCWNPSFLTAGYQVPLSLGFPVLSIIQRTYFRNPLIVFVVHIKDSWFVQYWNPLTPTSIWLQQKILRCIVWCNFHIISMLYCLSKTQTCLTKWPLYWVISVEIPEEYICGNELFHSGIASTQKLFSKLLRWPSHGSG